MSDKAFDRQIDLQGTFNFRDLGGYQTGDGRQTRWRKLFRSDVLQYLTEADVTHARDTLGIKTIIDLRAPKFPEPDKTSPLDIAPVQVQNTPVPLTPDSVYGDGNYERTLAEGYLMVLEQPDAQKSIIDALKAIRDAADEPLVFHCSLGKDRTGVVAAFLLGLLGVSQADIVADYALSEGHAMKVVNRARANPDIDAWFRQAPTQLFHAYPETTYEVLTTINNQYGSIRDFLLAAGGDEDLFSQLEDAFLE